MRITRILHHSVNVEGRLPENVAFYRDVLGVADTPRPFIEGIDGHWFRLGDAQVHLVDAPGGTRGIRPAGPHVCFGVADLVEAVTELEAAGIPYIRALQGATVQIWVADPAGNTVELQQDPATGAVGGRARDQSS